jgi:hypothetical protein
MGKFCLSMVASAGLLLALVASAEAGGGRTLQQPGQAFTPPGFGQASTNANAHAGWTTNSNTGQPQPSGWTNGSSHWNDSLGVPPGLAKCPAGLTNC